MADFLLLKTCHELLHVKLKCSCQVFWGMFILFLHVDYTYTRSIYGTIKTKLSAKVQVCVAMIIGTIVNELRLLLMPQYLSIHDCEKVNVVN